MAVPNSMRMVPYPWQLSGAAKINHLCRSSFGGGICGDPPGMGKTALAILAMELGAKENGSFSLVVCPSSCKMQWETEILSAYHEVCRLSTFLQQNK
jgi:superfamily II DNA or RNA helicase